MMMMAPQGMQVWTTLAYDDDATFFAKLATGRKLELLELDTTDGGSTYSYASDAEERSEVERTLPPDKPERPPVFRRRMPNMPHRGEPTNALLQALRARGSGVLAAVQGKEAIKENAPPWPSFAPLPRAPDVMTAPRPAPPAIVPVPPPVPSNEPVHQTATQMGLHPMKVELPDSILAALPSIRVSDSQQPVKKAVRFTEFPKGPAPGSFDPTMPLKKRFPGDTSGAGRIRRRL
jgi:hypothetical protein